MGLRRHFCWLLGHRYPVIWFKNPYSHIFDGRAGIADTEAGCHYCGHSEPNSFPIDVDNIDWQATKHRTKPPKHNVYLGGSK